MAWRGTVAVVSLQSHANEKKNQEKYPGTFNSSKNRQNTKKRREPCKLKITAAITGYTAIARPKTGAPVFTSLCEIDDWFFSEYKALRVHVRVRR